ncbi:putative protein kinase [Aspergillus homomorphus CBS 101889]|uniref:Kinase-like protein n=1 Tax=Aspergillus homomorphus (strain CBS 101889) TaxID=1450537 RepID=A0A395I9N7_ASPHC|nr:kinase-like protein [Aspergillus homomorphus CBS 101889]RAL14854.1 kinase-like protein [Aspergillus homomorphus CBS 101889]
MSSSSPSPEESEHEDDPDVDRQASSEQQESEQTKKKKKGVLSPPRSLKEHHDPEGHGKMVTAALLEFYCQSRAADILNSQPGSEAQYTRDSPEALYLGNQMYVHQSQFLSKAGVLQEGSEKEEMGPTRQFYRNTLDVLARDALKGMRKHEASKGTAGSKPSSEIQLHSTKGRSIFASPRTNIPLEDLQLDMDRIARKLPLPPFLGNSASPFPLFDNISQSHGIHMSRYARDFSEIGVLGRGSFGEVYHVKNNFDGQNYAIKRIPISKRRMEQLQAGKKNQLETILKEIRTIAKLDHANVVRYYSAWAEHVNPLDYDAPTSETSSIADRLSPQMSFSYHSITDNRKEPLPVVFENSEASASVRCSSTSKVTTIDSEDEDQSAPYVPDNPSQDQLSSIGGTTEDIFTDDRSHEVSVQVRRNQSTQQIPALILHIQMSMHPISLHAYLSPEPSECTHPEGSPPRRHCFHLIPSLQLMLDILSGVLYLHSKDIIHRDLKPANIFLSCPEKHHTHSCPRCQSDGGPGLHYCQPRIGDFGLVADLSHLNETPRDETAQSSEHGSTINHVVGTEFYRPPLDSSGMISSGFVRRYTQGEQPGRYVCDWSLDVYSLGIILFELLYPLKTRMERQLVLEVLTDGPYKPYKKKPYKKPTAASFRGAYVPKDFQDEVDMGSIVLSNGDTVAESLASCIAGMLDPDPRRRWQCQDIRKQLQDILAFVHTNPATTSAASSC